MSLEDQRFFDEPRAAQNEDSEEPRGAYESSQPPQEHLEPPEQDSEDERLHGGAASTA